VIKVQTVNSPFLLRRNTSGRYSTPFSSLPPFPKISLSAVFFAPSLLARSKYKIYLLFKTSSVVLFFFSFPPFSFRLRRLFFLSWNTVPVSATFFPLFLLFPTRDRRAWKGLGPFSFFFCPSPQRPSVRGPLPPPFSFLFLLLSAAEVIGTAFFFFQHAPTAATFSRSFLGFSRFLSIASAQGRRRPEAWGFSPLFFSFLLRILDFAFLFFSPSPFPRGDAVGRLTNPFFLLVIDINHTLDF